MKIRPKLASDAKISTPHVRWFVVQSVDSEQPVSKLSPFIIDKAIRSAVGTVKTIRSLRYGDFLLEVSSAVQSRIVNKLDNLSQFLLYVKSLVTHIYLCIPLKKVLLIT